MKLTSVAVPALAALALTLTACSSSAGPSTGDAAAPEAAHTAEQAEATAADPEGDGDPGLMKLGQTATLPDGLAVTATEAGTAKLSEQGTSGSCHAGDAVYLYKVAFQNGSQTDFKPEDEAIAEMAYTDTNGDTLSGSYAYDYKDDNGKADLKAFQDLPTIKPGAKTSRIIGFCAPDLDKAKPVVLDINTSADSMSERPHALFNS
ncbi:hypothetical protein NQ036_03510 [Brevibacterium sp. 91QC2O2]|uniref:hypothetical protein n=1 Tax=Brevibacterium sp. 91QC2O2 TaxID=2968458 RepID=UPI00211CABA5|nr:hypothetical protein [Brevibacterium sp. 91QC2O2]MCQ9367314.1 hypothetical protein [Brevibacterium sp. 91QC2O2]